MLRALLLCCLIALPAQADDKRPVIAVWPDKVPGENGKIGEEKDTTTDKSGRVANKRVIRLTNVSKPTLTVYPAPTDKATGAAIIVCPGGAYRILAMDLEGTEVCEWLNSIGVTAILLKYRVPARDKSNLAPLMDAQRAVSLVRGKAKEWKIDPTRIGILGFSAGGNLAARTALSWEKRSYSTIDKTDEVSCKPDFAVLVYPAYLCNDKKDGLREGVVVTKDAPPMFLAHAANDPVPSENSVQMFLALRRAKVEAELHIYSRGGHGYGLRKTDEPCTTWNERCAAWMKNQGYLKR